MRPPDKRFRIFMYPSQAKRNYIKLSNSKAIKKGRFIKNGKKKTVLNEQRKRQTTVVFLTWQRHLLTEIAG